MVEALWMWNSNATGTLEDVIVPKLVGGWGLEQAAPQCGVGVAGHRRAICVTRAFWDIVDDPPGDEDGFTWRDLGEVVTAFRSYPRVCAPFLDNNCRDEGGYDDNNWKDYKANQLRAFPKDGSELQLIERLNDLQGGNEG